MIVAYFFGPPCTLTSIHVFVEFDLKV